MLTDPNSNLNPEEKLLLSLCGLDFDERHKEKIRELIGSITDWDRYVKLVNEHGIIALEAYNLRELGLAGIVPGKIMEILDNARMKTMIRNTWLTGKWKEVNAILSEAGIRHLLLKGMALEHTVYNSAGIRQMNDVDILVKKNDILKAWLLLQSYGFKSDMIKSPLHRKIITDTGKHMPTLRKEGFPVELHHRLFMSPDKNKLLDNAIDNPVKINIEGTAAYIPGNDIHLEFLKSHFEDHRSLGGIQLRLWFDIELLSPGNAPALTKEMLRNPHQKSTQRQQREHYRKHFLSLPRSARFIYLAGDIFPSVTWMKERYKCGTTKALFSYPQRIGKLFRLI